MSLSAKYSLIRKKEDGIKELHILISYNGELAAKISIDGLVEFFCFSEEFSADELIEIANLAKLSYFILNEINA